MEEFVACENEVKKNVWIDSKDKDVEVISTIPLIKNMDEHVDCNPRYDLILLIKMSGEGPQPIIGHNQKPSKNGLDSKPIKYDGTSEVKN